VVVTSKVSPNSSTFVLAVVAVVVVSLMLTTVGAVVVSFEMVVVGGVNSIKKGVSVGDGVSWVVVVLAIVLFVGLGLPNSIEVVALVLVAFW